MAITSSIVVNPISVDYAIPISLLTLWYAADYLKTTREVKRLESIALSPIFDHFMTVITGLTTIRAFGRTERYLGGFRMGLIGAFFSASTAGVVVLTEGMDARSVGFVVSFTIRLAGHLSSLLSSYTSLEMDLNSLERMLDYCNVETEDESPAHCVELPVAEGRLEVTGLRASY
ncbi:hypothetical protein PENPOL_c010G06827 [Penicillium polonicum]|uniref:ABC transmembrane type-1 domain-containing protein n=1 Tax=Penicillium polonicum TaxID=60169 RepID=A0A1V6NEH3_PENPO|nr:hypothetical protein PENPOL_c010G06827 [Penicillium polonicum]